jgi:hypothetical protein
MKGASELTRGGIGAAGVVTRPLGVAETPKARASGVSSRWALVGGVGEMKLAGVAGGAFVRGVIDDGWRAVGVADRGSGGGGGG